jgi:hypothetical protein
MPIGIEFDDDEVDLDDPMHEEYYADILLKLLILEIMLEFFLTGSRKQGFQ